jgi:hypothetical protein
VTNAGASHRPIDIEAARANPSAAFATPQQIVDCRDLSDSLKIELLRRWAYDLDEQSVATEEGMPGEGESPLMEIMNLLEGLAGDPSCGRASPTKHHGLPETPSRAPPRARGRS